MINMTSGLFQFVTLTIFALGAGIFFFVTGLRWLSRKRLIENTPTSKIRSLAMGLVEIFGEIVPREKFTAPLSGNDCVYYKYQIEEYRSSGKSGTWVEIDAGEQRSIFYAKDETGMVFVNPDGAQIEIPPGVELSSGIRKDPPENIKLFLKSRGLSYEGFLGINKSMRFKEWHLAPGDKVYIMGTASDNPLVADGRAQRGVEDIMIMRGEHEKFYYISDKPEKAVLKSLQRRVLGSLIGGGFLIVAAVILWIFILRL